MADTYDMNTLLPPTTLQEIAQRWGSPAFYSKTYKSSTTAERWWVIHLFTGRVPSPEEFYYGTYVDRRGDSCSSEYDPLSLRERQIGYMRVYTNGYGGYGDGYAAGSQVLMNGAAIAEGVVSPSADYEPVARNENSDLSWMLDWSFSASRTVTLAAAANYSALQSLATNGALNEARPTWFMMSGSTSLPSMQDAHVQHTTESSQPQAVISTYPLSGSNLERTPILMGTIGAIGSGADLELATGHDSISNRVAPVSLRIKCNAI